MVPIRDDRRDLRKRDFGYMADQPGTGESAAPHDEGSAVLTECSGVLQVSKQEFDAQRVDAELDEALDGRFSTALKFVPINTGQRLAARPVVTEDAVKLQQSVVVGNRLSEGRRGVGESGQARSGLGDD